MTTRGSQWPDYSNGPDGVVDTADDRGVKIDGSRPFLGQDFVTVQGTYWPIFLPAIEPKKRR